MRTNTKLIFENIKVKISNYNNGTNVQESVQAIIRISTVRAVSGWTDLRMKSIY